MYDQLQNTFTIPMQQPPACTSSSFLLQEHVAPQFRCDSLLLAPCSLLLAPRTSHSSLFPPTTLSPMNFEHESLQLIYLNDIALPSWLPAASDSACAM
jgi:hypothetical protein